MGPILWNGKPRSPGIVVDEAWFSDPQFCEKKQFWYMLSKTLAEEASWKFSEETNPGFVICPYLQHVINLTGEEVLKLVNGTREIQIIRYQTRGFTFSRALLGFYGDEIHLCGDPVIVPLVPEILEVTSDDVKVELYQRYLPFVSLKKLLGSIANIQTGDCIVTFSRWEIHKLKKIVETRASHLCRIGVEIHDLTMPEIKQTARRANRYGSKFHIGDNTCFDGYDVPLLHSALQSPSPLIERAEKFDLSELLSNHVDAFKLCFNCYNVLSHERGIFPNYKEPYKDIAAYLQWMHLDSWDFLPYRYVQLEQSLLQGSSWQVVLSNCQDSPVEKYYMERYHTYHITSLHKNSVDITSSSFYDLVSYFCWVIDLRTSLVLRRRDCHDQRLSCRE
ncbi:DExH-box ATP-dependent RNA helicase DExH16, mitochondrial [Linum grandiflorum]